MSYDVVVRWMQRSFEECAEYAKLELAVHRLPEHMNSDQSCVIKSSQDQIYHLTVMILMPHMSLPPAGFVWGSLTAQSDDFDAIR